MTGRALAYLNVVQAGRHKPELGIKGGHAVDVVFGEFQMVGNRLHRLGGEIMKPLLHFLQQRN